jgi:hypothetical protein
LGRKAMKPQVKGPLIAGAVLIGLAGACTGLLYLVAPGQAYALFYESPWTPKRINESKVRGDGIVAALKAYRGTRGAYPDSLSELVPEFLKVIPNPTAGTREWKYVRDKPGQGAYYTLAFGSYRSAPSMSGGFYPSCSTQGGAWYHDE